MIQLKEVYSIKNDYRLIEMIQETSLDKKSHFGYKIENGLLFGAKKWFDAIDNGTIPIYVIDGTISNIYISGHNDYPEFELTSNESKTIWPIKGNKTIYDIGKKARLTYIEQKFKKPIDIIGPISQCIIKVEVEE